MARSWHPQSEAVLSAFDLLELAGETCVAHRSRSARGTREVAPKGRLGAAAQWHIAEPSDIVFRHSCKLGFEGIVSNRRFYHFGRSRDWIKTKNPAAPGGQTGGRRGWEQREVAVSMDLATGRNGS